MTTRKLDVLNEIRELVVFLQVTGLERVDIEDLLCARDTLKLATPMSGGQMQGDAPVSITDCRVAHVGAEMSACGVHCDSGSCWCRAVKCND